jgi:hypothetical protein
MTPLTDALKVITAFVPADVQPPKFHESGVV